MMYSTYRDLKTKIDEIAYIYFYQGMRVLNYNVNSSGSFMVDMGISSNIMKSPSPKSYMTFWDMVIYSDTLN